jgi:ATP synthase protein I
MVVGVIVALVAGLVTGTAAGFWSALYGAAVVVVPAALMARGMTSPLSSVNPMTSAFSYGVWQAVKIGASVLLLWAAPKLVPMLSWPALLAGLVVCIKVYWVALSWHEPR